MSRKEKVAQVERLLAELKGIDEAAGAPTLQAVKDALSYLEGAPGARSLEDKLTATKGTAIKLFGSEHTNMLSEQPSIQELRKIALNVDPALALQLFAIADNAEFELLYYAVTVHKGLQVAQKEFRQYARMEEQRLRAFEPAIREHDGRHDPKGCRMSFSLKLAMELAEDTAKLYVVNGKVVSKKSHQR